jgi:hypothetical protein
LKSGRTPGRYAVACALILALGIPAVAIGAGEGRSLLLGKRNPSTGSLGSETEVIASNGTYGTRQSNKRDGDGGGAIYGCRSNPGAEPCIRANNLKGGRAFEFATVGKEGGEIQVGDATGPPFVTNATGHVANLNADKLDGKDSTELVGAGELLFASVQANGILVAGRGATTAAKTSEAANTYTVTFNRDVSKCSFTSNAVGGASSVGGFGVNPGPEANQARVDQPGDAGADDEGRAFHLQVIC